LGRGFFPLENGYGRDPGFGRGLDRSAFRAGGVSNRSWFYDEQLLRTTKFSPLFIASSGVIFAAAKPPVIHLPLFSARHPLESTVYRGDLTVRLAMRADFHDNEYKQVACAGGGVFWRMS
jgi:hypothetical protein